MPFGTKNASDLSYNTELFVICYLALKMQPICLVSFNAKIQPFGTKNATGLSNTRLLTKNSAEMNCIFSD
jgi:hypothetical protein